MNFNNTFKNKISNKVFYKLYIYIYVAQSAGAVEYTDCFSAEG